MNLYELVSGAYVFRLNARRAGVGLSAQLIDRESGAVWSAGSAFSLDVFSIALQRAEEKIDPEPHVQQGDGWIDVTQTTDELLFSASAAVRFSLENEELVCTVATDRIRESRAELSFLAGVNILPGLLTVDGASRGHLVLPYRSGALMFPERHGASSDRFLIYGEQRRWELMPMLPCTGAVRPAESAALLAIAEQGECDAECRVDADGLGHATTGFSMRYRYTPVDPVDPVDRVVRFVPLKNANAGYAGMGRRMHAHVLKQSGRGTLAQRAVQNPDVAYVGNAFALKIMHACKTIGPTDGSGGLQVLTTFDEAKRQLGTLKDAGIERMYVQLTGWNLDGHDGCWPTRFPVEPALGGEDGLRALIEYGQSLGYQMQVHDNYIDLLQRSHEFKPDLCAHDIYGSPLSRGCWAGGINYLGWPLAYPDHLLANQMQRVRDLGVSGMAYLDAMGVPLELSYNKLASVPRYRRGCAQGVNRILRTARQVYGSAGVESGYLYCAAEADYIGTDYIGVGHAPRPKCADQLVPLWHMAIKGHAVCILNDTFQATVDLPGSSGAENTLSRRMLRMAEHGLMPRNEIVAVCGDWGYPLEPTIGAMKLEYDLMVKRLAGVGISSLEDHEILQTHARSGEYVSRSRFSCGIEVVCDYRSNTMQIDGRDFPLPNNFVKAPALPRGWRSPVCETLSDRSNAQEVRR